jgi:hypothetical protein
MNKFIKIKPKDLKGTFKVKIDRRKKTFPIDEIYGISLGEKLQELNKAMAWEMNDSLFGEHKDTRTPQQKCIDWFKGKISTIRVKIAEWIGGDALHENCDY